MLSEQGFESNSMWLQVFEVEWECKVLDDYAILTSGMTLQSYYSTISNSFGCNYFSTALVN